MCRRARDIRTAGLALLALSLWALSTVVLVPLHLAEESHHGGSGLWSGSGDACGVRHAEHPGTHYDHHDEHEPGDSHPAVVHQIEVRRFAGTQMLVVAARPSATLVLATEDTAPRDVAPVDLDEIPPSTPPRAPRVTRAPPTA